MPLKTSKPFRKVKKKKELESSGVSLLCVWNHHSVYTRLRLIEHAPLCGSVCMCVDRYAGVCVSPMCACVCVL